MSKNAVSLDQEGLGAVGRQVRVLGGAKTIKAEVHTENDLRKAVLSGLPKAVVTETVKYLTGEKTARRTLVYQIVSRATFARRARLSPEQGEKIARLARIIALAEDVFGSHDKAEEFMLKPHPMLDGETPWMTSHTESGGRQVEELLWKLFYGVAA